MTNDATQQPEPEPTTNEPATTAADGTAAATPATTPASTSNVPQGMRTFIVVAMAIFFVVHVVIDIFNKDYEGFQTSFLILGFVGLGLGIDLAGRAQ